MGELLEQIKVVKESREQAELARSAYNKAYEEWLHRDDIALLSTTKVAAIGRVVETEDKLRELTLKVYQETGNKKPAFGVGIRELTKLEYDPRDALEWAISHQIALSLDKKSFENFAKSAPPGLDFVEIKTESQATIASDLSRIL